MPESDKIKVGNIGTLAIRDLLRVAEVAKHGSISQAARALYIAQPALSKTIRDTESRLGFALFVRTARGVEPTPEACVLLARTQVIQAELERMSRDAEALAADKPVLVRIGYEPVRGSELAIEIAIGLSARFPELTIDVSMVESMETLLRGLEAGDLDFGLGRVGDCVGHPEVIAEPIYREELRVVCGPHHHLYEADEVHVDDLEGQTWAVGAPGSYSHHDLTVLISDLGITETRIPIIANMVVVRRKLVAETATLGIMQLSEVNLHNGGARLRALPITWRHEPEIVGATHPATHDPVIYRGYVEVIREFCARTGIETVGPEATRRRSEPLLGHFHPA